MGVGVGVGVSVALSLLPINSCHHQGAVPLTRRATNTATTICPTRLLCLLPFDISLFLKKYDVILLKHYSYKTEKSYINWIQTDILFNNKQHPREMDGKEIEEFLSHLAVMK